MMTYTTRRLGVAVFFLTTAMSSVLAAVVPPDVLVKQTVDEVLDIIRTDKKVQAGNVDRIAEIMEQKVAPHFDFPRMTRLAVGRPWRQATPEQRSELIQEFRTLLIRSYASAFTMFKAIVVEYKPLRLPKDATVATVNTVIRLPGGAQPVSVDYDMQLTDDQWKVFDVRIDGASLIINYRNVFAQEIQRGGIDGLINSLKQKNAGTVAAGTARQ